MQRAAKKVVRYTRKFQQRVVYAVMRDGLSIARICSENGIDTPNTVREWVREEMRRRGLVRIPKGMLKRKSAPQVLIPTPVERQLKRYEAMLFYQECLLEAAYRNGTPEQKKKLLEMLTPKQRKSLKQTGKLST
jgi:transposase-like protein